MTLLGQPPGPLVWQAVEASGSDYAFTQGQRYAVLASVSKNYSLAQVRDYLNANGWSVTYAWEQGTPSRGLYAIDTWLDSLSPDTTSNHRWLYAEANRTGASETLSSSAPWPLTLYTIATVFQAVPAPPPPPGAPAQVPSLPAAPSSAPPAAGPSPGTYVAAALVLGGLVWVLARRLL